MSSWFERWVGYAPLTGGATATFGDAGRARPAVILPQRAEAEIQAAERRYDEDADRIEAQADAERLAGHPSFAP